MPGEKSNLQKVLESGRFSVSAEIGPPMSADADSVVHSAHDLKGLVDAANVTDNQTAVVRMSSIAASYFAYLNGVEPVVQMTCRDRNRIAIQSDLLGAYALGLKNLLILSGDHQIFGNHPQSKNVYDVDSIQLIDAMRRMKEESVFMGGSQCKLPPEFFLGATVSPFADPEELQMIRLRKKIKAGAQFVQTQAIYDVKRFEEWMEKARALDLHKKTYILAGIVVNKSLKSLEMTGMVPGIKIPEALITRMREAGKENYQKEGVNIALELIEGLRKIEGVSGIHIMAIGWESIVPSLVERAGFLPRPVIE